MALTLRAVPRLFKEAAKGWKADNCMSMGAALAFYSLLSMAPLMVLVITVAGLVIGHEEAQALLFTQLSGLLGETGTQGVRTVLEAASNDKEGLIQSALSFVVLLIGATTVFGELQDDLNRIWKAESPRASGIWGQVKKRLLSFGLIVVIGFLLLVSLAVSAAVSYLSSVWLAGAAAGLAHGVELLGSLIVMTALFALTFRILPNRSIPWSDVLAGALVTAALFSIGKFLIGLYIGRSAVASDFGAAGALVVAIMWVYYSSQIFFFGAELTRAYSLGLGSSRQEAANAEFSREDEAMVERARRIVKGHDPVLLGKGA